MKTNEINELKDLIIRYAEYIDRKSFSPGTSGNISHRFEDKIIISASGSSNGGLTRDDLVVIDFDGNVVDGNKKASSEKLLHIEFYKMRPDVNAIIHVHPVYLSSFASVRKPLDEPIMSEIVFYFGKIPLADYALPSSDDLAKNTAKYFKDYNAVLMANHGFVVGDTSMKDAYLKLELAESYAQVVYNTYVMGGPVLLNEKEVADINALKL